MTSFAVHNFGCRVNQAEASAWVEELEAAGLKRKDDPVRADIVIVNTCTLTARADRDGRKFLRRIARLNPGARLVITGCGVDGGRVSSEDLGKAWLILKNKEKSGLPESVLSRTGRSAAAVSLPLRSRALLKVQDGCDLSCAFCIIPKVRGPARSVGGDELVARTRSLIRRGFREIVLCGIHLSSYGRDLSPPSSLRGLLRRLISENGLGRIRLSSLDPRFLDQPLLEFITSNPKICPHFHLSLQHGTDRMLTLMGRGSTSSRNASLLVRLRERAPDAALGADIIVGFPGESEEDFERMFENLASSPLNYLHVFSYSPRPGTPAALMPQVPQAAKNARSRRLRELSREMRLAFRRSMLGRELDAVVIKKNGSRAQVLTGNYLTVELGDCRAATGEDIRVRILRVEEDRVLGETAGTKGADSEKEDLGFDHGIGNG